VLSESYTHAQTVPYVSSVQRQVLADLVRGKYCDSVRVALSALNFDLKQENFRLSKALENAEGRATALYTANGALITATQKDKVIINYQATENRKLKRKLWGWKILAIAGAAYAGGKSLNLY
jgi:hypothetical protein